MEAVEFANPRISFMILQTLMLFHDFALLFRKPMMIEKMNIESFVLQIFFAEIANWAETIYDFESDSYYFKSTDWSWLAASILSCVK